MTHKTQPTAHAEITAPISADLRRIDDAGAQPAPITLMTEDRACTWAWDQVREDVGTEGWTTSESCNFYGFFMWGWIYRGQYETQRPPAPPAPAAVAVQPAALESSILDLEAWEDRSDGEPMTLSEAESVSLVLQELKRLRALAAAPAQPAAWMTPEGDRVVTEATMAGARKDGGAMLSSLRPFTVPLARAAAPAQAWPSECDSPELCQVHRGCAGQYGTKNTCPSLAALNPCNSAATAQAVAVPAELELPDVEDMAHSAMQEALSFGVNHDVFHRWMRAVMDKTVQALAAGAAQAPEQWIDDPHDIEQGRMLNPEWVRAQEHATQLAGPVLHDIEAGVEVMAWLRENRAPHSIYSKMSACLFGDPDAPRAAPAQAQEDACPVLDDEWKRRMLDGRALVRDDMGCGYHPALPTLDEGMNPKQFFEALGIQLAGSMADGEMDMDAYDAMVEATDYNVWTPETPAGDGWVLVAIFDTEDGPAAWWIRQAAPKQPARRGRKSARDAALPSWWPDFIQSVAELPDRNSPEDEPDAMVATADELGTCAINAIDAARAAQGGDKP